MLVVKIESPEPESLTRLVAKACFLSGFSVQSFTLPGKGYVKFDKQPVVSKQEEFSDFLILADPSRQDSLKDAKEKSTVLVNSSEKPRGHLVVKRKLHIYALEAKSDAALLGAFVRHCDKVSAKSARLALGESKDLVLALEEGMRSVK